MHIQFSLNRRLPNKNGRANCEMSDLSWREIDRYTDLIEDSEYTLFSRSPNAPCGAQQLSKT